MSGAIGFWFERIRDRKLAEHTDRKEHFQKIREEVLQKMIDHLGIYRSNIYREVGGREFPIELKGSRPTSSKLFDTLQSHFREVKTQWDGFERKMESFGKESTVFYHSIEDRLLEELNLSFERLAKFSDTDLAQHVCVDFYGRLVDRRKKEDPVDAITVKPHGEKWSIDSPHRGFFIDDRESFDAVNKIRDSLQSLASNESVLKQASKITRDHTILVEDSDSLESTIRDAMARSKLEGKCKYCP